MIYLLIAALVFLGDFAVKRHMEDNRIEGAEEEIMGGRVIVRKMSNRGMAGSLFSDRSRQVRTASGLVLGALGIHFIILLFQKGRRGIKFACSLIFGGGLSNFVDRCTKGYVTDYFSFNVRWKKLKNLVFNLSDLFILLGCAILCLKGIRGQRKDDLPSGKNI